MSSNATFAQVTTDELLNTPTAYNQGNQIATVRSLPNKSWQQTLASVVTTLLNITGALALLAFTVGGVTMVIGSHKTETLEKGKKIVVYSLIGLVIIAVSYAIVIGVAELEFFTAGT